MMELIKVVRAEPVGEFKVRVAFSDGREGIRDFADVVAEGGTMVEPLRDPAFFARAFVQSGVLAWPNGLDFDAIALHSEMDKAGLLSSQAA